MTTNDIGTGDVTMEAGKSYWVTVPWGTGNLSASSDAGKFIGVQFDGLNGFTVQEPPHGLKASLTQEIGVPAWVLILLIAAALPTHTVGLLIRRWWNPAADMKRRQLP